MPFIRQEDIVDALLPASLVDTYKINSGNELNNATVATKFALGFGLDSSSPLQIKEFGINSNFEWTDEQDVTLHNQTYDETNVAFYSVVGSPGTFKYNSMSATLNHGNLVGVYGGPGTWTNLGASSALNTNRYAHGCAGNYNGFTIVGGYDSGGSVISSTEIFNGVSFVSANNLNLTKAEGVSFGSYFAMMFASGIDNTMTIGSAASFFNGNSWAANGVIPALQYKGAALGSYNAALLKNGQDGATPFGNTYIFNGNSWEVGFGLSEQIVNTAATGSFFNGILSGGVDIGVTFYSLTYLYNGYSASIAANLNSANSKASASGTGTAAVNNGGYNGSLLATTELFNGHLWSLASSSSIARSNHSMAGTTINSIICGNSNIAALNVCEQFSQNEFKKITPENINSAAGIGVFYNSSIPAANRCSIKISGFLKDMPIGTANDFLVVQTTSLDNGGSNNYQTSTSKPTAEDYVYGKYDSVNTKIHVFNNLQKTYNNVKRWG